jgi:hypothetical protein
MSKKSFMNYLDIIKNSNVRFQCFWWKTEDCTGWGTGKRLEHDQASKSASTGTFYSGLISGSFVT